MIVKDAGVIMAKLEQLEVPDDLLADIARRAKQRGVSIEQQVVTDLTIARAEQTVPAESALMDEIRRERDALARNGVHLTDDRLRDARNWGRR